MLHQTRVLHGVVAVQGANKTASTHCCTVLKQRPESDAQAAVPFRTSTAIPSVLPNGVLPEQASSTHFENNAAGDRLNRCWGVMLLLFLKSIPHQWAGSSSVEPCRAPARRPTAGAVGASREWTLIWIQCTVEYRSCISVSFSWLGHFFSANSLW